MIAIKKQVTIEITGDDYGVLSDIAECARRCLDRCRLDNAINLDYSPQRVLAMRHLLRRIFDAE